MAPYAGWDTLRLPGWRGTNDGISTTQQTSTWLTLELRRATRLAVVWRGQLAPPTWLAAWTRGPNVTMDGRSLPTFTRDVAAGKIALGGVNNPGVTTSQQTYLVLAAEAGGVPTAAPSVPAGMTVPVAN